MVLLLALALISVAVGVGANTNSSVDVETETEILINTEYEYEHKTFAPSPQPTFVPTSAPTHKLRRISRTGCRALCAHRAPNVCAAPTGFKKCQCYVSRHKCLS